MRLKNKYNNLKIAWYPDKLNSFVQGIITAPIYIRVKPTNKCCHNCIYCVYNATYSGMHQDMSRKDELEKSKLLEVLNDFADMGVKSLTFSGGGEPLFYPYINEAIELALNRNLAISVITNGQYLRGQTAALLATSKWVRVSMDYHDQKSFVKIRQTDFSQFKKICQNIENFSKIKGRECNLTTNWIISQDNYENIPAAVELMKNIGIELIRFSPLWTRDFHEYHNKIKDRVKEILKKVKKFEDDNFEIVDGYNVDILVSRINPKCFYNQIVPVVAADGNVYTCHNKAYDPDAVIGSIKNRSFKEMWFSKETKTFLKTFDPMLICKNQCANEQKNINIQTLIDCYGDVFP
jgi:radical SAM protein with 4Fe4S-binding SPASM domain